MAKLIEKPSSIKAAGNKTKIIQEYIGRVNSGDRDVSIAIMESPEGWIEPSQTPDFDEYTLVLEGQLLVKTGDEELVVHAGQAVSVSSGETVQYSSPFEGGARYVAVCLPAFSPETVHREE